MTQEEMYILVPQKLKQIEQEYGIRILYAAESGSRAWGTNSDSSDFDVRFIYIQPRKEYLRLDQIRDVLEFPIADGWDMCGWDLRKTLKLLHNSNSQIYEWFSCPVVYVDDGFSARFRPILEAHFSTRKAVHHYLHQAELKRKKRQKAEEPKVKHYLYSLQHISAARWILEHRRPVPVDFQFLSDRLPESIRPKAREYLLQKTTRPDQPYTTHCAEVEEWLLQETNRIRSQIDMLPWEDENSWDALDRFFLQELTLSGEQ